MHYKWQGYWELTFPITVTLTRWSISHDNFSDRKTSQHKVATTIKPPLTSIYFDSRQRNWWPLVTARFWQNSMLCYFCKWKYCFPNQCDQFRRRLHPPCSLADPNTKETISISIQGIFGQPLLSYLWRKIMKTWRDEGNKFFGQRCFCFHCNVKCLILKYEDSSKCR